MWIDALPHCGAEQATAIARVHPYTLSQVVKVESQGETLALHVNGLPINIPQPHPTTTSEAISVVRKWVDLGYSVDMGVTQLNTRTATAMHLAIEQVLGTSDNAVCGNLAAGATVLAEAYTTATLRYGQGQQALQLALSLYNSGDATRGFLNGYVGKYFNVPALTMIQQLRITPVSTRKRRFADTEAW